MPLAVYNTPAGASCMHMCGSQQLSKNACEDILHDSGAAQSFFSVNVQDEYDPARPNDYEEIRRTRERQRVDAEREAERQEELRAQKAAQEVCFYLCHTGHVLLDTCNPCFRQQHSSLSNAGSVHQSSQQHCYGANSQNIYTPGTHCIGHASLLPLDCSIDAFEDACQAAACRDGWPSGAVCRDWQCIAAMHAAELPSLLLASNYDNVCCV